MATLKRGLLVLIDYQERDRRNYEVEAGNEDLLRSKFALACRFALRILRSGRDVYGFTPVEFEVFLSVAASTLERIGRDPELRRMYGDKQPLPEEELVYVSARAVCAATDLNRETVRRAKNFLVENGHVTRGERGYALKVDSLHFGDNSKFVVKSIQHSRQLSEKMARLDQEVCSDVGDGTWRTKRFPARLSA